MKLLFNSEICLVYYHICHMLHAAEDVKGKQMRKFYTVKAVAECCVFVLSQCRYVDIEFVITNPVSLYNIRSRVRKKC